MKEDGTRNEIEKLADKDKEKKETISEKLLFQAKNSFRLFKFKALL